MNELHTTAKTKKKKNDADSEQQSVDGITMSN